MISHPVGDGHGVVDAEHHKEGPAEGDARQQDVADPRPPVHLLVVGARHVAGNPRGEGIQHDEGGVEAAPVVRVENAHARQPKDEDRQRKQLRITQALWNR